MATIVLTAAIMLTGTLRAQEQTDTLTRRQQRIVEIAACTGRGDLESLRPALASGLDDSLTVSEIRELLIHSYAYCGFPRSLRALQTFIAVLGERRASATRPDATHRPSPTAAAATTAGATYWPKSPAYPPMPRKPPTPSSLPR